jgi:protein involved in polysaccharide export with SLBB domain
MQFESWQVNKTRRGLFPSLWLALLLLPLVSQGLLSQSLGSQSVNEQDSTSCIGNPLAPGCTGETTSGAQLPIMLPGSSQTETYRPTGSQVYVDSAGFNNNQQNAQESSTQKTPFPPEPPTDMQRLAAASTGERLPVFGSDLFQNAPSTFAPADQIPVLADSVIAPGDQLLVRLWGPENFNGQLTVDNSGSIYIPNVGAIHVAGFRADQLQAQISNELQHSFKNFNLSVNLGHLHSIQVYVVGEARRPGAYTVSAMSTLLNVLFVSGGPNARGSMRHIQVRRGNAIAGEFDLYDLLLRGDKANDIRLEPNDTIFIPTVGPQVAVAGSVRHPAIYELRGPTTVGDLIDLAGGFTEVSAKAQISLERVEDNQMRAAMTVTLDDGGRAMKLQDGDILFANHISSAFSQSVTIRGNLANPGRFPWHAGMHLSDIIPDRMSLLTPDYWQNRNRLGMPVPMFKPLEPQSSQPATTEYGSSQTDQATSSMTTENHSSNSNASVPPIGTGQGASTAGRVLNGSTAAQGNASSPGEPGNADSTVNRGTLADEQQAARQFENMGRRNTIDIPAPEINWSYAVIERLDPKTLKNSLVPFNLGKLVIDNDASQNLELQPGDIVTILSQADVHGPQDEQTKYVRLEGEINGAGVYSVGPNESLDELVQRAGGLSSSAYLYGSSFTRESARIFQQQRLDEYISSLSVSMQRDAAVRTASAVDPSALAEEQGIISQMRKLRATGRIVLEFRPASRGTASIPHIPLEDGDVFSVPSRPSMVAVIGSVYGQNVFLYNPKNTVQDYLKLAGKPSRTADMKHAFIIRADGSILSRDRTAGAWKNNFETTHINPGDSIVVPEKPIKPSAFRQIMEYSQLFSQFALGAAAISVVAP